jgi:DNA-binding GntR family transcriptional regulator
MTGSRDVATTLKPIVRRSTEEVATESLREYILGGRAPAGSWLTEFGLSESLRISRGTVRTALQRLSSEGLVRQVPYKGWQVTKLSTQDVWELYTLRARLEALGARLTAEGMNDQRRDELQRAYERLADACKSAVDRRISDSDYAFHQAIVQCADHRRLREQYHLIEQQMRLVVTSSNALIAQPALILQQHRPLLRALLAADVATATTLIEEHALEEGEKLRRFLEGSNMQAP